MTNIDTQETDYSFYHLVSSNFSFNRLKQLLFDALVVCNLTSFSYNH